MCGIAGIVSPEVPQQTAALGRMIAALRHRGPDGEGSHVFSTCALGHTRLSVVDVAGSAQPMLTAHNDLGVIFNGEIYGYQEARRDLTEYPFRTMGDTEVLLALYDRHRESMLAHLPGMFAFALWDDRRRQLFCARDRFGEKPFFYAMAADGTFVFASEIKAILASGLVDPAVDPDSVAHYLRYLYVHPHRTIYRNVHVLPPAHTLRWRDGRIDVERYWQLPACEPHIGVDEAVERFRTLLEAAVRRQLVADVPVGAFLSGGLDSSTLVALAAKQQHAVKTFSFGFGREIDERPYAAGIAMRYGTDHHALSDGDVDLPHLLRRMAYVYDEPFGDSSNVPTYLLCEFARRHVTVALTGEGADELLAGYGFWYRDLYDMDRAAKQRRRVVLARAVAALCRRSRLPLPGWARSLTNGARWRRTFATPRAAHEARTAQFSAAEIARLVPGAAGYHGTAHDGDGLDAALRADLTTYLPGDILVKADRASMAHGLELRAPFLDRELASFCVSLPSQLKITASTDKVLLRQAFAEAWTPEIRRRHKQGFGAPVLAWLKRPSMQALKAEVLNDAASPVYDLVSRSDAAPLVVADDYRTWALLVLGLWADADAARRCEARRAVASAVH